MTSFMWKNCKKMEKFRFGDRSHSEIFFVLGTHLEKYYRNITIQQILKKCLKKVC